MNKNHVLLLLGILVILLVLVTPDAKSDVKSFVIERSLEKKVFDVGVDFITKFLPKEKMELKTLNLDTVIIEKERFKVVRKVKLIEPLKRTRFSNKRTLQEIGEVKKKNKTKPWNAFVFFNKSKEVSE